MGLKESAMSKQLPFETEGTEICPECDAKLVIRNGQHGPFFACSSYPECQYTRPLRQAIDSHTIKILEGQDCPACGHLLALKQGRFGMFIGCSNYPECEHTELIDKPDETSVACPQCQKGQLLQRKSRFGKTFYACDSYPECQFIINNKPFSGECEFCQYPLLMEKKASQGVKLFCASKRCGKQQKNNE